MASWNSCTFIGNVARDPEVRFLPGGEAVASFTVAVNETWKDRSGNKNERVEWVRCEAWGKLADVVKDYVTKGKPVAVEGSLKTDEWEKDGQKKTAVKIRVNKLQLLGPKGSRDETQPSGGEEARFVQDDEEAIPF